MAFNHVTAASEHLLRGVEALEPVAELFSGVALLFVGISTAVTNHSGAEGQVLGVETAGAAFLWSAGLILLTQGTRRTFNQVTPFVENLLGRFGGQNPNPEAAPLVANEAP